MPQKHMKSKAVKLTDFIPCFNQIKLRKVVSRYHEGNIEERRNMGHN